MIDTLRELTLPASLLSFDDVRPKVFCKGALEIVLRLPTPVAAGGAVVAVGGPGVVDRLAAVVGLVVDVCFSERLQHAGAKLIRLGVEAPDVVNALCQLTPLDRSQLEQRIDTVRHGHERDARIAADYAGVRLPAGSG